MAEPEGDKKASKKGQWRGRGGGSRPSFARPSNSMVPKGDAVLLTDPKEVTWRHFLAASDMKDASIKIKIGHAKKYLDAKAATDTGNKSFLIHCKDLLNDKELQVKWPTLKDELLENATKVLGIFGQAASEDKKKVLFPRLKAFPWKPTVMEDLKASQVNKLLCIKGTLIRVANVMQMNTWLTFQCLKCDSFCSVEQKPKGRFTRPKRCPAEGCQSQTFTEMRTHPMTMTVNSQMVRLQECANTSGGRVPRTVNCHLTRELCDSVGVGDVVSMIAVARVSTEMDGSYNLYLEAVSIINGSLQGRNDKSQVEFTYLDYSAIRELFDLGPELFKLLVASLCPSIYGHELVKAGLLLALFGGTSKYLNDSSHVPVRGDPHVLIVGDPGLGKSQMLQSCFDVAPKSVFVTATGASTTGLTVTITKGAGNEFVMEAGALVLADEGCCCIDEFDKMPNQHPALLEAMEQQSISLAKSGVSCSVKAQTAILAAANPVGGHYNKAKTVSENLKMHPALLSRFDLVFILIDKPDEELDCKLSDHIMNLHRKSSDSMISSSLSSNSLLASDTLSAKLIQKPDEVLDLLPRDLMKKYIAYARKYVKPKLTSEAAQVIQDFYMELRRTHQSSDATPITTRQLESIIRLTQARAKLNLRSDATAQDAMEVIEIMKSSMLDTFSDEVGQLDFSRSLHGSGMSKGSAKKKFVAILEKFGQQGTKLFSTDQLKQIAMEVGLASDKFSDTLESLNTQGYLLKKGQGMYQLLLN